MIKELERSAVWLRQLSSLVVLVKDSFRTLISHLLNYRIRPLLSHKLRSVYRAVQLGRTLELVIDKFFPCSHAVKLHEFVLLLFNRLDGRAID